MSASFQNNDNFIRNMVTLDCGGGALPRAAPITKRLLDRENPLPILIEDIASDIRIDDEDDLPNIMRLALGAADFLERRTAYVLAAGRYELVVGSWWTGPVVVTRGPLRAVTGISYRTGRDTWTSVSAEAFFETRLNDREFAINLLSDFDRPALWTEQGEIRVTFEAGYTAAGESSSLEDTPDGLLTTLTALVAHYYKNRELFQAGKAEEVEAGAGNLLNAFRMIW